MGIPDHNFLLWMLGTYTISMTLKWTRGFHLKLIFIKASYIEHVRRSMKM